MKKILGLILFVGVMALSFVSSPLALADDYGACSLDQGGSALCSGDLNGKDMTALARDIINIVSWTVGVASVIVIIYAGFTFITSQGNSSNVKRARDMITYAVIGLIVAIMAYAIVNFVVNNL